MFKTGALLWNTIFRPRNHLNLKQQILAKLKSRDWFLKSLGSQNGWKIKLRISDKNCSGSLFKYRSPLEIGWHNDKRRKRWYWRGSIQEVLSYWVEGVKHSIKKDCQGMKSQICLIVLHWNNWTMKWLYYDNW